MFFIELLKKNKKGTSLIEVLIVMLIVVIAFNAFYTVSTFGTKYIIEAKNRLAASALMNEKMEIVRNLSYNDIGTQESVDIPGNLRQEESVTTNGHSYQVSTSVRYFDDIMDGTTETSPEDVIPNDYKVVRIIVSWNDSNGQQQNVSSTSRFVPPGLETDAGGSPLAINVISNSGTITSPVITPVSQASVNVINNSVSPIINDTVKTDDDGHIMFPSARIASSSHVIITKNGYETVETMNSTATFTPVYRHIDVVAGASSQYSFEQNRLSNITIKSVDYQNNPVGGIEFSIEGGKLIGYDSGLAVFSMPNTTGTTGITSGEKEYANISPGNYNIIMSANTQYEFIDFDPSDSPAELDPGDNMTYTLRVANKNTNGLFLKISDTDGNPVADAEVKMTDGSGNEVFSGKKSSARGVVFYPDSSTPLINGNYTLEISAVGFQTKTGISVTINENTITEENIQLEV